MTNPFKVAVLTPSTGNCRMEYAQALARLVAYFSMVPAREGGCEQAIVTDTIIGSSISANYEHLILKYLGDDQAWTHFLFIEDDMGFFPDVLHILASRHLDIVGANYLTNKGWPIRFTAMGLDGKTRIQTSKNSAGVERAGWIPQGLTLVTRRVFEMISRPWFITEYRDGRHILQDQYFGEKARAAGLDCWIDHAVSKRVWHVGPHSYRWDERFEAVEEPA